MGGSGTSPTSRIKHSFHIGGWGNPYEGGGQPGKGIVQYAISSNRVKPFAGMISKGFWNTLRRSKNQVLYVVPPFILGYYVMQWSIERNHYLHSKAGRKEFEGQEE